MKKLVIATIAIMFTALSVQAQVSNTKCEQRKIKQGLKNGSLTVGEAVQLELQKKALQREAARYKSDGVITPAERRDLQKDNRRLNANIFKQKHDRQRRN